MKTKIILFFALTLSGLGGWGQGASQHTISINAQEQKGSISFFVRDNISYLGIKSTITVEGADTILNTDAGGHFVFTASEGKYVFTINSEEHNPLNTFYTIEKDRQIQVDIILDRSQPYILKSAPILAGYLIDKSTGKPIESAKVEIDKSDRKSFSNKIGYFEIDVANILAKSTPEEPVRANIIIKAKGFKQIYYEKIVLSKTGLLLRIDMERGVGKVKQIYYVGAMDKVYDEKKNNINEQEDNSHDLINSKQQKNNQSQQLQSPCPTLPSTIRVGTGCNTYSQGCSCASCTSYTSMSLESYVQSGLNNEWLTGWNAEALKSGAVCYRTFGAYKVASNPSCSSYNFDIYNTDCDQAWTSGIATDCQNAAIATAGEVMVNSSGTLTSNMHYAAENNNYANCGDGYVGRLNWSYPCNSDAVGTGYANNGHGAGECQYCSNRWASSPNYKTYTWILDHYYNSASIYRCSGTPPTLDCSSTITLSCGVSYSGTTVGGNSDVSTNGCNSWSDTGPERVHVITTTSTGTITATLSNLGGIDLDVFILSSCDMSTCLGTVTSSSATYSNAPAGTYFIIVDGYLGASGSYTLNVTGNCGGGTPNLTKSADNLTPGTNSVTIDVTVQNNGTATAAASRLGYYLSTSSSLTLDYLIGTDNLPSITAGGSSAQSITVSLCGLGIPNGTYYAVYYIDDQYAVSESSETDNGWGWTSPSLTLNCVSAQPDLIVLNPSVSPSTIQAGAIATVYCNNKNQGSGTASSSYTAIWLSQDQIYNGSPTDTWLSDISVPSLTSNQTSSTLSQSITIPSSTTSGTWYIMFGADATNTNSNESDENNNQVFIPITVQTCTNSTTPSSASASPSSLCSGTSSTLTVNGGSLGTSALWYWYSGSCGGTYVGSGSSISVNPSSTTTYYVRAEGTCNTTTCVSVTVTVSGTQSTAPSSASANPSSVCSGYSSTLTVNGGSLGTGASWKWYSSSCGGTYFNSGNSISVTPSSTTTYYVRAEGTCNTTSCTSVTVTVSGTQSTAPSSASANPSSVCSGNTSTLTVNGGSLGSGASWQWYSTSCGGTNVGSGNSISVTPSLTTTYYVRAEGTCNSTSCVSTTVSVSSITLSTNSTNTGCGSCTGSVSSSATGGTPVYTYNWSGGLGSGQSISNVCAGNYIVTVTDANGCTTTATESVGTINGPAVNSVTATNTNCGSCTGSASVNFSGGNAPYTYLWNGTSCATQTCYSLCSGQYNVTVTDNNGCIGTGSGIVTSANAPIIDTPSVTDATCGNSNGQVCITVSGGTPPYNYLWNNGQTGNCASGLSAGNYSVTVTDSNNCSSLVSATVIALNSISISTSSTNANCGQSDGTATAIISGGTSPYSYLWSDGQTTETATGLSIGTYSVTITDSTSCQSIDSITVNEPILISISATSIHESCYGSNDGSATVIATGGTPPYTYLWSTSPVQTADTAIGLGADVYSVTITDSMGCSGISSPVTINTYPLPDSTLTVTGSTVFCADDSVIISAGNAISFLWNTSDTTQTIIVKSTGMFSVYITDSNNCSAFSDTVSVLVNPLPPTPIISASGATIFCKGTTVTLSAPSGYTYSWSNGGIMQNIIVSTSGNYIVTVTDTNGCESSSAPVSVTSVPDAPIITASGSLSLCPGESVTLTSSAAILYNWSNGATTQSITVNNAGNYTVTITDGNGCSANSSQIIVTVNPAPEKPTIQENNCIMAASAIINGTYQWYFNGNIIPAANGQIYTGTDTGYYSVQVTDINGCSNISNLYYFPCPVVGINEIENGILFNIFPNPTNGSFTISIDGITAEKAQIIISNVLAQDIYISKPEIINGKYTKEINLDNISDGVYFVQVKTDTKTYRQKLLLQQ